MGESRKSSSPVWVTRIGYGSGVMFGLVALTILTAWLFLKSPFGEALVVDAIVGTLSKDGEVVIRIGDIDGDLPSAITLQDVVVGDELGDWLTVDQLSLKWRPFALLTGKVEVDFFTADVVNLQRLPVLASSKASETEPDIEELANVLARVRVKAMTISQIEVAPEVIGRSLSLSLEARLEQTASRRPQLTLTMTDLAQGGESSFTALLAENQTIRAELEAMVAGSSFTATGSYRVPTNAITLQGEARVLPSLFPVDEVTFTSAKVDVSANGTLAAPLFQIGFEVQRPRVGTVEFSKLDGTTDLRWAGESVAIELAGGVTGVGKLAPSLAPLIGADALYAVTATLKLKDDARNIGLLAVSEVSVESGDLAVSASGEVDLGTSTATGAATVKVAGLGRLAGWEEDVSQTEVRLDISSVSLEEFRASFVGVSDALKANSDMLTNAMAGPLKLSGGVIASPQQVRIENTSLAGLNGTLDGTVDVNLTTRSVVAELQASIDELKALSPDFEGPLSIDGDVSGPLDGPVVSLRLASERVAIRQETLDEIKLSLDVDLAQSPMATEITGSAQIVEGELKVNIKAAQVEGNHLQLDPLSLQGAGIDVTGALNIDLSTGLATGNVDAEFETLALPSALLAVPLSGGGAARVDLSNEGNIQKADLNARAESLRFAGAKAGMAEVAAEGEWRGGAARSLDVTIVGNNGFVGDQALASIQATAIGPLSELEVKVAASAPDDVPRVTLAGEIDMASDDMILSLADFALADAWGALSLLKPARIEVTNAYIRSSPILLAADDGTVTTQLDLNQITGVVQASLVAENLPFDLLSTLDPDLPITGRFTVDASLEGALSSPSGFARFYTTDIALPDTGLDAVGVDVDVTLADRRLSLSASVAGVSEVPATINGSLPFVLNLSKGQVSMPLDEPVDGAVQWAGDIQPVWAVLPLISHRLTGGADLDLNVSGTLNEPEVTGYASLAEGVYENLDLGTLVRDLNFDLSANTISDLGFELSGSDGDGGLISGSGALTRALNGELAGGLALKLDRLRLVRRDDLKIKGSGELIYGVTPERDRIAGDVQVESAELSLTASYAEAVPTLDVVDPNAPQTAPQAQRVGKETDLAIAITAPKGIDVVGRGLDSEWTADVNLGGTLASPELTGSLDVTRGEFSFLGELFDLSQGEVRFTGGGQIDPELSIIATRSTGGITAQVEVQGRASSPSITLGSIPVLPQDEVLSRILFGRSAGQLGPLEAVQLANAATELAGLAGRGGVVGSLRRGVGLDVFRFGSDAGGSTVVVGERISRNVFVGVEQGLEGQGSQFIIEWQLTDNLGLKSTTRQDTGADIGLRWSRDY